MSTLSSRAVETESKGFRAAPEQSVGIWIFWPKLGAIATSSSIIAFMLYGLFLATDGLSLELIATYPFGIAVLAAVLVMLSRLHRATAAGLRREGSRIIDAESGKSVDVTKLDGLRVDLIDVEGTISHVVTAAQGTTQLRFADLASREPRHGDIINVPSAALVLAWIVEQSGAKALYPDSWSQAPDSSQQEAPSLAVQVPDAPRFALPTGTDLAGIVALGVKLVPKVLAMGLKLLKAIKPGAALLTLGTYSLIFSWQFGVALIVMVGVHECGHVYAMWRSGVEVKGIYFLPFFGGAAVSKGIAKTRAASAFIAINGPVWGALLALFSYIAYLATEEPMFAAFAAWGALLNLFNLLPIYPLDGGRLVACLAYSHFRRYGIFIVFVSLLAGAGYGYLTGLELLFLVAILGAFELLGHVSSAPYADVVPALGHRFSGEENEHFHRLVRPVMRGGRAEENVASRVGMFDRRIEEALQTPMTPRQGTLVLVSYVGLAAALVALLLATSGVEGAGDPLSFLR